MSTSIHPTAIIEPGVELADGVEIGAYAFVGQGVKLGKGTKLHHHASVVGDTTMGEECEVFPYAYIGAKTQDLKFKGGTPGTIIGSRNVFREYVSVHAATFDAEYTVIGSDNYILAYCHVAHDCVLGNHIVMSNSVGLAGHVQVQDHVVMGAMSGVHQFCRIGAHAMVSAYAKVVQDVCPFFIADGQPAIIRAINKVGLERRGFTPEQLDNVKQLYKILFRQGHNRSQAMELLRAHPAATGAEFHRIIAFADTSERGLAPAK